MFSNGANISKATLGLAACSFLSLMSCQDQSIPEPSVSDLVKGIEISYSDGKKVETFWDGVSSKIGSRASDEVIAAINEKADIAYKEFGKRFKVSAYLFDGYAVGVVPEENGCPEWSEKVEIFMDNEDSNNATTEYGWTGAIDINGSGGSALRFCKVDGRKVYDIWYKYSVLQLGSYVPSEYGSVVRLFVDNENSGNANYSVGDLGPNTTGGTNTTLYLAVNDTPTQYVYSPGFPSFDGFKYGVFSKDSYNGLATGYHWADDEDGTNSSKLTNLAGLNPITNTNNQGERIPGIWIVHKSNGKYDTRFELAKVR